eukprot:3977947-Lingulodinium_polyedra.AAC.1
MPCARLCANRLCGSLNDAGRPFCARPRCAMPGTPDYVWDVQELLRGCAARRWSSAATPVQR